jgi:hypothetical protein
MKNPEEKPKKEELELKFEISDTNSEMVEKLNKIIEKEVKKK